MPVRGNDGKGDVSDLDDFEAQSPMVTVTPSNQNFPSVVVRSPTQRDSAKTHQRNESISNLLPYLAAEKTPSLIQLLDANHIELLAITTGSERPFSTRVSSSLNRRNQSKLGCVPSERPGSTRSHNHKNKPSLSNEGNVLWTPIISPKEQAKPETNEIAPVINTDESTNTGTDYPKKHKKSGSWSEERERVNDVEKEKQMSQVDEFVATYNAARNGNVNHFGNEEYVENLGVSTPLNDSHLEKKDIAIRAAQEFMVMVTENDKLNREHEVLQLELQDLKTQMLELNEELQKHHNHSRKNSTLMGEKEKLEIENEALQTQIKMLQERLDDEQESIGNRTPSQKYRHVHNSSLIHPSNNDAAAQRQDLLEDVLRKLEEEIHQKDQVQHEIDEWRKKYEELMHKTVTHQTSIQVLSGELERMHQDREELEQAFEADLQEVEEAENVVVQTKEENIALVERMRGMTIEKSRVEEQAFLFEEKLKEQQSIIEVLHSQKDELTMQLEEMQTNKLAKDDEMFSLLRELRVPADKNKTSEHQQDMSQSLTEEDGLAFAPQQPHGMTELAGYCAQKIIIHEFDNEHFDLVQKDKEEEEEALPLPLPLPVPSNEHAPKTPNEPPSQQPNPDTITTAAGATVTAPMENSG